ncbi:phosphatidylserine decarboxylase [Wolbachia endosymbiont of Howardula sp.]|uniref:phosphatidylserine decarboxylase n=1 Tax=Wolbachia endosymbiont of Howardula sp. TaxID=2916816 RepID=UPI00217D6791|nr:phosphatidylserine decarboxylase [Wolbachia endosymbiont of Howardula sp.]UWI83324.1 phosphatidylserine decarboxylase [Wolbachia endosymbiont of Howardula sp.]
MKCYVFPNIHKSGYPFIFFFCIVTCIACVFLWTIGVVCIFLTLLCIYFFRDPVRIVPDNKNLILSPADGIVSHIQEVIYPQSFSGEENRKYTLISIFLSVFNVHVNRIPISGTIKKMQYKKGSFLSAMNHDSCNENEKQIILIEYQKGKEIILEQIAGMLARRIICHLTVSQHVTAGERFGIIRFGSRVNIYLPSNMNIRIAEGQTLIGGETIIASLSTEDMQEKPTYHCI